MSGRKMKFHLTLHNQCYDKAERKTYLLGELKSVIHLSMLFTQQSVNIYREVNVYAVPINHNNDSTGQHIHYTHLHLLSYMRRNRYNNLELYYTDWFTDGSHNIFEGSCQSTSTIDLHPGRDFYRTRVAESSHAGRHCYRTRVVVSSQGPRRLTQHRPPQQPAPPIFVSCSHFMSVSADDSRPEEGRICHRPTQQSSEEESFFRDVHSHRNHYCCISSQSTDVPHTSANASWSSGHPSEMLNVIPDGAHSILTSANNRGDRSVQRQQYEKYAPKSKTQSTTQSKGFSSVQVSKSQCIDTLTNTAYHPRHPVEIKGESNMAVTSRSSKKPSSQLDELDKRGPLQSQITNERLSPNKKAYSQSAADLTFQEIHGSANTRYGLFGNTSGTQSYYENSRDFSDSHHVAILGQLVRQGYCRSRIISAINYFYRNTGNSRCTTQDLIYIMEVVMSPET